MFNPISKYDRKTFRDILEYVIGITYPQKILNRRLELLNEDEKQRMMELGETIENALEEMDAIIVDCSERNNDPWTC